MDEVATRLFVCYVPGFDRRCISAQRTPYLEQLLAAGPAVEVEGLLGSDLLPTILTGVYPNEHRLWQLRLRPEARIPRRPRLTDHLPGIVSTTLQCAWRLVDRSCHLPAIPSRRRRRFEMRRPDDRRRGRGAGGLEVLGDYKTVLTMIADSRYRSVRKLRALERLADTLPGAQCPLEFLEIHALDQIQHWHMDAAGRIDRAYQVTDAFIGGLHARCRERDVTLMVLADHGQEPVSGSIPLMRDLRSAGVAETDYSCFFEPALARFWFHTEEARARLTHVLREVGHTRMLMLRDLRDLHLPFEDDAFGELFLAAEPGWIFFPNDLHHPVGNLFLGLFDGVQRPRLVNPRPRGAHGYLPEHPSERGFAIVADPRFRALRPTAGLIDVAPTLFALLGETPPAYMRGRAMFG